MDKVMVTAQRDKINILKVRIKPIQKEVDELDESIPLLEDEEVKKEKSDHRAKLQATLQMLKSEVAQIRMNKNGSEAFEWHPHRGMNRQQAKWFKRNKSRLKSQ